MTPRKKLALFLAILGVGSASIAIPFVASGGDWESPIARAVWGDQSGYSPT